MGRTGQALKKGQNNNWFSQHRKSIIWAIVIIVVLAVVSIGIFNWYHNRPAAAAEDATVTMTSPKSGESIQNFYQVNLTCSDPQRTKKVVVKVEDKLGREIKGKKNVADSEIIWVPNNPIVDQGAYNVLVSGKGIKADTFTFFIPAPTTPPTTPPPATQTPTPTQPGQRSSQTSEQRKKDLDDLANKYPVQP